MPSFGRGPAVVNDLHDFLSPAYRVRDCADRRGNSLPAIKLRQLAGGEDTRGDQQQALAAFVHTVQFIIFAFYSPPYAFLAGKTSPVVYTCGVSVLRDLRRTMAVLGGL
jgi:hypothetical protein